MSRCNHCFFFPSYNRDRSITPLRDFVALKFLTSASARNSGLQRIDASSMIIYIYIMYISVKFDIRKKVLNTYK